MHRTIMPQIVYLVNTTYELYVGTRHYYYNRRSSVDLLSDKREIVNNPSGYIIIILYIITILYTCRCLYACRDVLRGSYE